jgi:GSH-dependent disulfide-bond oxidoreductase
MKVALFLEESELSVWGRARSIPTILGPEVGIGFDNVGRHLDDISSRPAALRTEGLKDRTTFKREYHNEARRQFFSQNARLAPKSRAAP